MAKRRRGVEPHRKLGGKTELNAKENISNRLAVHCWVGKHNFNIDKPGTHFIYEYGYICRNIYTCIGGWMDGWMDVQKLIIQIYKTQTTE